MKKHSCTRTLFPNRENNNSLHNRRWLIDLFLADHPKMQAKYFGKVWFIYLCWILRNLGPFYCINWNARLVTAKLEGLRVDQGSDLAFGFYLLLKCKLHRDRRQFATWRHINFIFENLVPMPPRLSKFLRHMWHINHIISLETG